MCKSILTSIVCLFIGFGTFSCQPKDPSSDAHSYEKLIPYNSRTGGVSLLINHQGRTILEDYPNGGHPDSTWLLASGTKGFMSIIVAAAVQDGIISSIDEKLSETVTEWANDDRKDISLRQLLTLSSGLETQKGGPRPTVTYKESLELPLEAPIGSRFAYGPTPFQTFGEFMFRKLANTPSKTAHEYLQERIFNKLGITVSRWWRESDNYPRLASGAYMSARDWMVVGEFVKQKGKWKGEQLLDEATFEEVFKGTDANPAYGFGWWLNRPISRELLDQQDDFVQNLMQYTRLSDQLPEDFFFALGGGNQRMYIIPSQDLIVVRQQKIGPGSQAEKFEPFSDVKFLQLLFNLKPKPQISRGGIQALDQLLDKVVAEKNLPMVAVSIANSETVIYEHFAGFSDPANKSPIDEHSIFGIRSMTKPITTVAILQLMEQGMMELDAPIGKYLPQYQNLALLDTFNEADSTFTSKTSKNQPTIRQLLSHSSGITYGLFDLRANAIFVKNGGRGAVPDWEKLPLMFEPGSAWSYGMGHRLCGWALEKVTGQSLEAYCKENIFLPLGMENTQWMLSPKQQDRLPKLFEQKEGKWEPTAWPAAYAQAIRGDGGMFASLGDYTTFAQMLLNKGTFNDQQILQESSLEEMFSNQIGDLYVGEMPSAATFLSNTFPDRVRMDKFGLGVLIRTHENRLPNTREPGSYGWDGLLNTYFWVDETSGIAVIFYTQVLPFFDKQAQETLKQFEQAVYKNIGK